MVLMMEHLKNFKSQSSLQFNLIHYEITVKNNFSEETPHATLRSSYLCFIPSPKKNAEKI